jgi:hypothetical protein
VSVLRPDAGGRDFTLVTLLVPSIARALRAAALLRPAARLRVDSTCEPPVQSLLRNSAD